MPTITVDLPTRVAAIRVMDDPKALYTCIELQAILFTHNYITTPSKLRGAMRRMERHGYVAGSKRPGDPHCRKQWQVTQIGLVFASDPWPNPKSNTRRSKGSGGTHRTSSKGSSLGGSMCQTSSKPTLEAAVRSTITDLIQQGKKFSAYDVTKALRDKVNVVDPTQPSLVDTQEVGVVHVQGQAVPRIDHDEVRDLVRTIYTNQEMVGYECDHNGTYFEYHPATAKAADPAPAAPDPSTPPATSGGSYDGTPTLP